MRPSGVCRLVQHLSLRGLYSRQPQDVGAGAKTAGPLIPQLCRPLLLVQPGIRLHGRVINQISVGIALKVIGGTGQIPRRSPVGRLRIRRISGSGRDRGTRRIGCLIAHSSCRTRSASQAPVAIMPRAPALEQAAANSPVAIFAMPPWMMGNSVPRISFSFFISFSFPP